MKRVVVTMSDECHKALKQYAAFYGKTMDEVLYHNTRAAFHKQALVCSVVEDIFRRLGITNDKRQEKPCFGFLCNGCVHSTACRTGVYQGVVVIEERLTELLKETGKSAVSAMQIGHKQDSQFDLQDQ